MLKFCIKKGINFQLCKTCWIKNNWIKIWGGNSNRCPWVQCKFQFVFPMHVRVAYLKGRNVSTMNRREVWNGRAAKGTFFPVVGHTCHTLYTDKARGSGWYLLTYRVMSDTKEDKFKTRTVLAVLRGALSIIHYIRYCVCKALLFMQHNLSSNGKIDKNYERLGSFDQHKS